MESCTKCETKNTAEHVCPNCGLISDVPWLIQQPSRAHDFDEPGREDSKVRADRSAPTDLAIHDFGLGSYFDCSSADEDVEKHKLFTRMKKLNEDVPNEADRSMRAAMCSIDILGELLELTKTVERRIAYLYRKAVKRNLTQRRDLRAVLGALASIATREAGTPRARETILNEVNKLSSSDPQLGRHYGRVGRDVSRGELEKVERKVKEDLDLEVPVPTPEQYVPRFATVLGLDESDAALAMRICRFVNTTKLGHDPKRVAAVVLYRVARKKITALQMYEKLPFGYTSRVYPMADKVTDLILDQVINKNVKVSAPESPWCLERRFDEFMARYDSDKVGEAKEILYELSKREDALPTKDSALDWIKKLAANAPPLGKIWSKPYKKYHKEEDNMMYA